MRCWSWGPMCINSVLWWMLNRGWFFNREIVDNRDHTEKKVALRIDELSTPNSSIFEVEERTLPFVSPCIYHRRPRVKCLLHISVVDYAIAFDERGYWALRYSGKWATMPCKMKQYAIHASKLSWSASHPTHVTKRYWTMTTQRVIVLQWKGCSRRT